MSLSRVPAASIRSLWPLSGQSWVPSRLQGSNSRQRRIGAEIDVFERENVRTVVCFAVVQRVLPKDRLATIRQTVLSAEEGQRARGDERAADK